MKKYHLTPNDFYGIIKTCLLNLEMKLPGNWDVKLKDFSNAYVYINIPCNDVCGFCDHAAVS